MIRRPPRSTHCISSAASDVYKRQLCDWLRALVIVSLTLSSSERPLLDDRLRLVVLDIGDVTTHSPTWSHQILRGSQKVPGLAFFLSSSLLPSSSLRGQKPQNWLASVFLPERSEALTPSQKTGEPGTGWIAGILPTLVPPLFQGPGSWPCGPSCTSTCTSYSNPSSHMATVGLFG